MKQKSLAKWLKIIIIGVGICGLIIFFLIVPELGHTIVDNNPEFAYCYSPWLGFLWLAAIPCYAVLVCGWKIACNIGIDNSFSQANADYLKWISWLMAFDSAFFFIGNVVLMFMNMNHPGIMLMSLLVVFIGVAITVAAAALSHLVAKAADLQQQSDLTI